MNLLVVAGCVLKERHEKECVCERERVKKSSKVVEKFVKSVKEFDCKVFN